MLNSRCIKYALLFLVLAIFSFIHVDSSLAQICTDADGDGYGLNGDPSCPGGTFVDCDDTDPNVHPGAIEICDGKDSNCDGSQSATDRDVDGDGVAWCEGDCNDNDPNTYPGAVELCDGKDNDCNSSPGLDELDSDNDGFLLCDAIPDCNDFNANINPDAQEVCSDGADNNCDGETDELACICPDADGDGQLLDLCGGSDCNDSDPDVYIGAAEDCNDGKDNDCDGLTDIADPDAVNCPTCTDIDGDGYFSEGGGCGTIDCDDSDPSVYPGAIEICDGKDTNCDGYQSPTDKDVDGDGVAWCQGDCNDNDPATYPGAAEVCDGIDNNCNGAPGLDELDSDEDGFLLCDTVPDCDDFNSGINPDAQEICADGEDNNCNGQTDEEGCICPDSDGDGYQLDVCGGTDCNDNNPNANPGTVEDCNDGIDNDCDGLIDIADPDAVNCPVCSDGDGDGFNSEGGGCGPADCDDSDPSVFPGAIEVCDGKDSNCDGYQSFTDRDKDGDGVAWCAGDCNDNSTTTYPGAPELCDGIDNNCNGSPEYNELDSDSDGFRLCDAIPDCNDFNASVNPNAQEVCLDNVDNDCNGQIDEAGCICPDADGDGFQLDVCGGTDCDDSDNTVYPGAAEICTDFKDNDCDELIDRNDPDAIGCPNCTDSDGDGYATEGGSCGLADCDDTDPAIHPSAVEICDGKDTNCDGYQSFTDMDKDNDGVAWCAGDCNDNDPAIFPGAAELCDGVDNDCNGGLRIDEGDADNDGYRLCDIIPDCNDFDSNINPGAQEICSDGADNNCDGQTDELTCICPDADSDGHQLDLCGGDDCNDNNPTVFLGATEECNDGLDNDCDGLTDIQDPDAVSCPECNDADGDGYYVEGGGCGAIDCDDGDSNVHPGAPEICDGKDSNCDGSQPMTDVDNDGDGVAWCQNDCNDSDPNRYPGNMEICDDGIDNDCDNLVDSSDSDCVFSCNTKTKPKSGPHMFDLLDSADDSLISTSCNICHYDDQGNDVRLKCQRCHADPSDTSDPYNGVRKSQYPLSPPYGFGTAPNVKLHSSTVVGTKYGNWTMECVNCHNPHQQEQDLRHGTNYGKLVKEYICLDNPVTGLNTEEVVQFTADTGAGSFADGAPHNENICEACHTQTNHHRRDGSAPADFDGQGNYVGHNDGARCVDCHPHGDGFKPNCGACHAVPPPTGTHLKHFGGTKDNASYGSTTIAQDVTAQGAIYLMNCGNCHPMDGTNHQNGVDNPGGGTAQIELYNPSAPAGSLKSLHPPEATYTPGNTILTDSFGMKYTEGTCDNVYCHSTPSYSTSSPVPYPTTPPYYPPLVYSTPWETLVVKSRAYQSPTWGVDSLGCDGCHGYPITNSDPTVSAGVGDSHAWIDEYGYINLHAWNMSFDPLQCKTCHYDTVRENALWVRDDFSISFSDINIYNTSNHVNGTKDIVFTPIPVPYPASYGTVFHDPSTATYDPDTSTCFNVSCHKSQTEVKWGSPYRWWNDWECNVCHQN